MAKGVQGGLWFLFRYLWNKNSMIESYDMTRFDDLIYIAGDHYIPDRHHSWWLDWVFVITVFRTHVRDFEAESPILIKAAADKELDNCVNDPDVIGIRESPLLSSSTYPLPSTTCRNQEFF